MRLATFLPPGADAPGAGEVRGDEVVAFGAAPCSTGSRPATGRPPTARRSPLAEVTLLAPVPRPRAIFGIGLNYAAHARETGQGAAGGADRVHEAADVERRRRRGPVRCPAVVQRLDYEVELALVIGPAARSPATRSPTTSPRATCRSASRSGRAPRAPTRSARGARGSRPPTRSPDAEDLRLTTPRQRRAAPGLAHVRPDLRPARARRLHRRGDHAGARRPHPHRDAERRRPGDGPAAVPRRRRRRALRDRAAGCDRAPHLPMTVMCRTSRSPASSAPCRTRST